MTPEWAFAVIYGAAMLAVVFASVLSWRRWTSGNRAFDASKLGDVELALLNGGPELATLTAATVQRQDTINAANRMMSAQGPVLTATTQLPIRHMVTSTPPLPTMLRSDVSAATRARRFPRQRHPTPWRKRSSSSHPLGYCSTARRRSGCASYGSQR